MNIPDKVVNAIEMLPFEDRSQVYCAVIGFMASGKEPEFEMSETARVAYLLVREILDPILHRRMRDKARRLRKKNGAMASPTPTPAEESKPKYKQEEEELLKMLGITDGSVNLTRQQRRRLQRLKEKNARRLSA